jgi:DNA/RNA-binding domain of Phe-tRNA-synthetase-like protein
MILEFVVNNEVKELGLVSAVAAEMTDVCVTPHHDELEQIKHGMAAKLAAMTEQDIQSHAVLEGYREVMRRIGRSLKKFPPAAESLLRQVRRTGKFPTINTVVDSYNVVVANRMLALGVHDRNQIVGRITFRRSNGGEQFRAVASEDDKTTQIGDLVYADDARVLAWLDSKDSDTVKVTMNTTALLIVIQGTSRTTRSYNLAAAEEACLLIQRFCGGKFEIKEIE